MSLNAVKILGISITTNSKKEILEYIQKYLQFPWEKPLIIVTPNPEQIVFARDNARFAKMLNQAEVSLPDGIGIASLLKIERIAGVEFVEDMASLAAERGYGVGLIGGRGGVAVDALECLQKKYPDLLGWAVEPEEIEVKKLVQKIRQTNTRIVFVGLGAPKQEFFIEKLRTQNLELRTPLILMSVGGSFDIIAGRIPRAPIFIRLMGFEWAWRLFKEPWRLGRQFALVRFLLLVFLQKFSV